MKAASTVSVRRSKPSPVTEDSTTVGMPSAGSSLGVSRSLLVKIRMTVLPSPARDSIRASVSGSVAAVSVNASTSSASSSAFLAR